MKEALDKTIHDLKFATGGLLEALGICTSVESIIVLDMIERVRALTRNVEELKSARESDGREA